MTYASVGCLCFIFFVFGMCCGYVVGFTDGKLNDETAAREEI